MKSRYLERSHVPDKKIRQVVELFCRDLNAKQIAEFSGISRPTVNKLLMYLRNLIAKECDRSGPFSGEIEVDESYFGPHRVRGRRGRGAGKKIIVFGLLKRNGKVYTQVIKNASRDILKQIITERIADNSTVYSDGWKAYDGLVDWGYKKHFRVSHGDNEFVDITNPKNHINGIESFWGVAKVRLSARRGIKPEYFNLHLKECEWRFNHRFDTIDVMKKDLLTILRKDRLGWGC